MIKLNNRLKAISELTTSDLSYLDIGCDHGLLEVYLLKKNIKIVGTDNKQGPLDNAKKNFKSNKVDGELRLGDGLDEYNGEDGVIICGMGGINIIGIIRNNISKIKDIDTFILSPNNYIEAVRKYLVRIGYYIENEVLVKDKYIYNILVFKKGKKRYKKKEYYFGPILLQNKDKLFYEYYERELKSNQIIQKLLPKNDWSRQFLIKKKIKMIESELK